MKLDHKNPEPVLTEYEVAKLIGVAARTLQLWRQKRIGPPYLQISRRTIRYRYDDVMQWVLTKSNTLPSGDRNDTSGGQK